MQVYTAKNLHSVRQTTTRPARLSLVFSEMAQLCPESPLRAQGVDTVIQVSCARIYFHRARPLSS